MQVEMITLISGTRDGADWPPIGGVLEVSDDEGLQLIRGRVAKPYEKPSRVEVADKRVKAETATKKGLTKADL